MLKLYLFFIICIPILIYAQPNAEFTATPLSGNKSLQVTFSDLSTPSGSPIVFWFWDFGDGGASITPNPVYRYRDAGVYTVSLTVRDDLGQINTETKTNYITVNGPRANFTADPRGGVIPLVVNFTDLSTTTSGTITSWFWNFGDGSSSYIRHPSHSYSTAGNYDVSLIITNSIGQRDTLQQNSYVKAVRANFSASPLNGTNPLLVDLQDESTPDSGPISSWFWDFGDGLTSTAVNPNHSYANPGVYNVSLTITDTLGHIDSEVKNNYISVVDEAIVSSAIPTDAFLSNGKEITVAININMTGMPFPDNVLGSFTGSLEWNPAILQYLSNSGILQGFTGGVNTSNAVNGQIIFNGINPFGREGVFDILFIQFRVIGSPVSTTPLNLEYSAMARQLGAVNILPFLIINDGAVTVVARPTAQFQATPLRDYEPATITFSDQSTVGTGSITNRQWAFGDGTTGSGLSPTHIYQESGLYSPTLTIFDIYGESDTLTLTNYINIDASFVQTYIDDWNMIGVPVIPRNSQVSVLYPDAIPGTTFRWIGSYQPVSTLKFGEGYWIKFPNAGQIKVPGPRDYDRGDTLTSGWNLISGVSGNVDVSTVYDPFGIIVPGTWYGWNGTYAATNSIEAGRGYWVLADEPGVIAIFLLNPGWPLDKRVGPSRYQLLDLEQYPFLTISDAAGAEQKLYLDVPLFSSGELRPYLLPPLPPEGAFDARFSNQSRVCADSQAVIQLQGDRYPLSIKFSANTGIIVEEIFSTQSRRTHFLAAGDKLEIIDPQVKKIIVMKTKSNTATNIPSEFELSQNYPNPFNPITIIEYALPSAQEVEIMVYNALGQKVRTLVSKYQSAGYHQIEWDGTDDRGSRLGSGIYYYQVSAGPFSQVRKMLLLK